MEQQEDYKQAKQRLSGMIAEIKKKIEKSEQELEGLDSNDKYNERQREYLRTSILPNRIEQDKILLAKREKQMEFFRPSTPEIEEYKKNILNTYNDKICKTIPEDLHLLFHGTTIYSARDIIESKGISSPGERGEESDITSAGEIWVTSKESASGIHTSLSYAFLENSSPFMPDGCIFVLETDEETEKKAGKSLRIESVSFEKNPDVLFSIITTPENIEMVRGWCERSGIDIGKVQDYESFLQILQDRDYSQTLTDRCNGKLLEGAVQATEVQTKISDINSQFSVIKENNREKTKDVDKEKE